MRMNLRAIEIHNWTDSINKRAIEIHNWTDPLNNYIAYGVQEVIDFQEGRILIDWDSPEEPNGPVVVAEKIPVTALPLIHSPRVRVMQDMLGFKGKDLDGVMGAKTISAIIRDVEPLAE